MSRKGEPREPLWTAAELAFLRENYSQMSNWAIGQQLGRSLEGVRRKAQKCGLQYQFGRPFTPDEDAYIRTNYETSQMREMVAALGRHHNSVRDRARQLGLSNATQEHRRAVRATVRHDYFSQIDTPVKAYVLGVMASDGTVASGSNGISVKVKPADVDLVKFVRDEVSPRSRIYERTQPPLPGYTAERPYVGFAVSSAQIKADLVNLGITPRKSHTLQYPHLAPHLTAAFILGCYDGDGCLWIDGLPGRWQWHLYSASEDFLVAAREVIRRHTGLELRTGTSKRGLHRLRLNGGKSIKVLDAWLHADVPGLARKSLTARQADSSSHEP